MSTPINSPADDFDFMPDDFAADLSDFEADYQDEPRPKSVTKSVTKRVAKANRAAGSTPSTSAAATAAAAPSAGLPPAPLAFNLYGTVPDPSRIPQAATQRETDMGLGSRIVTHYGDVLRFAKGQAGGYWISYTGTHWEEDDKDNTMAQAAARTVIASVTNDEPAFAAANDPAVVAAQRVLDKWTRLGAAAPVDTLTKAQAAVDIATERATKKRADFGERLENGLTHIAAALRAATTHMSTPQERFNANPYLLNFLNGTVDVRTMVLKPHDPRDYITKVCAVNFVPGAKHADLDTILVQLARSDDGLPLFLQRYLGSSCTGLNTAKAFTYLKGPADAGKTTLFEAHAHALGDVNGSGYGRIVSPKLFALSTEDGEGHNDRLHKMRDVTFILADEAEAGFMNRETVNKMSAGGAMNTRPMYGSNVSWRAKAKIVFSGNDWMPMPDNDPGLTRRLIACELTHKLAPEEIDVNLQDRIRTTEALEAILAWAVQGAHDWIAEGADKAALHPTAAMVETSANYLASADPLGAWWDACIVEVDEDDLDQPTTDGRPGSDFVKLTTDQLQMRYAKFCKDGGSSTKVDAKHFAARLTARGFPALKNSSTHTVAGTVLNRGKFRLGIRHTAVTTAFGLDLSAY